ncbi:MAG TPA: MFS transporter [Dehalococcoidia bacterium]|nr:MFS transporter [Dehalococcoidia bacterium]
MAIELADTGLLRNSRFRRLLGSRLLGQTAGNAMIYTLLILVVVETDSSFRTAILLLALTLPGIILAIPAGISADVLPKRTTLMAGYLARAAIAAALAYYQSDLVYVYLLAAASSTVGQFFSPAESAAVPAVVQRDQLTAANSWMVLTLVMGQVAGMVALAPILLKLLDHAAVFAACSALFLSAALVVALTAEGFTGPIARKPAPVSFARTAREGFRILSGNREAYLATVYLTTAVAVSRVLVVILPKYVRDVLGIQAEDIVFVAAPAAIGAGLGLLLAPMAARLAGAWRSMAFGFGLFLLSVIALCVVVYVRNFLNDNVDFDLGIGFVEREVGVSSVITITMLLAIPLGFSFTLLSIASRVVINEQAPPGSQGRVFAVQGALADLFSLPPLMAAGIAADAVGERPTLMTAAIGTVIVTALLTFWRRWGPTDAEPAVRPAER